MSRYTHKTVPADQLNEQQVKFLTKYFSENEEYAELTFEESLAKLRKSQR